jgi:hypothetical protein
MTATTRSRGPVAAQEQPSGAARSAGSKSKGQQPNGYGRVSKRSAPEEPNKPSVAPGPSPPNKKARGAVKAAETSAQERKAGSKPLVDARGPTQPRGASSPAVPASPKPLADGAGLVAHQLQPQPSASPSRPLGSQPQPSPRNAVARAAFTETVAPRPPSSAAAASPRAAPLQPLPSILSPLKSPTRAGSGRALPFALLANSPLSPTRKLIAPTVAAAAAATSPRRTPGRGAAAAAAIAAAAGTAPSTTGAAPPATRGPLSPANGAARPAAAPAKPSPPSEAVLAEVRRLLQPGALGAVAEPSGEALAAGAAPGSVSAALAAAEPAGRGPQFRELWSALERACRSGRGSAVYVSGLPGASGRGRHAGGLGVADEPRRAGRLARLSLCACGGAHARAGGCSAYAAQCG